MGWLTDTELLIGALVLVAVLLLVGLFARRRWLSQSGPMFECWLNRQPDGKPTRWITGVARYNDGRLQWFRTFSWALKPGLVLTRELVRVTGRRPATAEEQASLPGVTVLRVDRGEGLGVIELAMTPGAQTGLTSWLEAAPPGLRRLG